MGEAEPGSKVSLDYGKKGPESWIWRWGSINQTIEDMERLNQDWTDMFWMAWRHVYPYADRAPESDFMYWWKERSTLTKDERLFALAEMNLIAAKLAWTFTDDTEELTVPGIPS